jgi:hypothetical protein
MSSLSYESILEALAALSFSDKLRLNEELATSLRKEGKSGAVGKAIKKEKKVKDPSAKPRKTAVGTMAWIAFVKHCKSSFPERFTDCAKEPERLTVAKAIREEDQDAYQEFIQKFKDEHASAASSDEDGSDSEAEVSPAPTPAPAAPSAAARDSKLAEMAAKKKAAMKESSAAGGGGGAAAAPAPKPAAAAKPTLAAGAAAKEPKEKKAAPAAKEPKEPKPAKAKKEVKKATAAKEAAAEEAPTMEKKEIDGVDYFFDPELNGLWMVEDGQLGAWVGKFQPGNEEEPIRFTDSPADE